MRTALLLECSPRRTPSVSRLAAALVVQRLQQREPDLRFMRRDLAAHPPALIDQAFTEAMHVPAVKQSERQRQALAQSERLIAELEMTDMLVIGTPMHNFTVPVVLKAWIDQVVRVGRTFRITPNGKEGLLVDRPTYVVVASGGFITDERARQPDFLTPYLQAMLTTLGIHTIRYLYVEATHRDMDWSAQVEAWLESHLGQSMDQSSV